MRITTDFAVPPAVVMLPSMVWPLAKIDVAEPPEMIGVTVGLPA